MAFGQPSFSFFPERAVVVPSALTLVHLLPDLEQSDVPVVGLQLKWRKDADVNLVLDKEVGHILNQVHNYLEHEGPKFLSQLLISLDICQFKQLSECKCHFILKFII